MRGPTPATLPLDRGRIVELDDILRERTAALRLQRDQAKAALDRARAQSGTTMTIDAAKIDAFARLMNERLEAGNVTARKAYISSIVDAVEVGDRAIRIIGSKDLLQAAVAGRQSANGNVRGFVRKWRARDETLTDATSRRFISTISPACRAGDTTSIYHRQCWAERLCPFEFTRR